MCMYMLCCVVLCVRNEIEDRQNRQQTILYDLRYMILRVHLVPCAQWHMHCRIGVHTRTPNTHTRTHNNDWYDGTVRTYTNNDRTEEEKEEYEKPPGCYQGLKQTGHMKSMVLTFFVWFFFLGMCISGAEPVWLSLWIIVYIGYLVECWMSSTWRYLKNQDSGDGTVKLLDSLVKASPTIHWYVECYHYETRIVQPTHNNKNVVLWVYGSHANATVLTNAKYTVEVFRTDFSVYQYVRDYKNRAKVKAIILPGGMYLHVIYLLCRLMFVLVFCFVLFVCSVPLKIIYVLYLTCYAVQHTYNK